MQLGEVLERLFARAPTHPFAIFEALKDGNLGSNEGIEGGVYDDGSVLELDTQADSGLFAGPSNNARNQGPHGVCVSEFSIDNQAITLLDHRHHVTAENRAVFRRRAIKSKLDVVQYELHRVQTEVDQPPEQLVWDVGERQLIRHPTSVSPVAPRRVLNSNIGPELVLDEAERRGLGSRSSAYSVPVLPGYGSANRLSA